MAEENVSQSSSVDNRTRESQMMSIMSLKNTFFSADVIKIRNNVYYSLARSLKVGLDIDFVLRDCNLTARLLNDLGHYEENEQVFENILVVLNSFERLPEAACELLRSHHKKILELLYKYDNKAYNRVALLKVLINLTLKCIDKSQLIEKCPEFFVTMFQLIVEHPDEEVQENIAWLVSAMIEQTMSEAVLAMVGTSNVGELLIIETQIRQRKGKIQLS